MPSFVGLHLIHVYESDAGTVTVQEYEPFTYVVHEDTKIGTIRTAQSVLRPFDTNPTNVGDSAQGTPA